MFKLDYRVSTQMCRLRNVLIHMFAHYNTSVYTLFNLRRHVYESHLTYDAIFFFTKQPTFVVETT